MISVEPIINVARSFFVVFAHRLGKLWFFSCSPRQARPRATGLAGFWRLAWLWRARHFRRLLFAGLRVIAATRTIGNGRFLLGVEHCFQFTFAMRSRKTNMDIVFLAITPIRYRYTPTDGVCSKSILEAIRRRDITSTKTDELVAITKPAAIGVGIVEDIVNDHSMFGIGGNGCAKRGVVDNAAAPEYSDKSLDLIDGNRITDADIHAAALFKRSTAINADEESRRIEHRTARIAGIYRGIRLQAVSVFKERAGWILVPMHSRENAIRDRGLEVVR